MRFHIFLGSKQYLNEIFGVKQCLNKIFFASTILQQDKVIKFRLVLVISSIFYLTSENFAAPDAKKNCLT